MDYTIRWTTPAAELMTSDGTFIRTFVESQVVGIVGGGATAVYPGFDGANRGAVNTAVFSTDTKMGAPAMYLGLGDLVDKPDGGARALICFWYEGTSGSWIYLDYMRSGATPPVNQAGSANRPTRNVFGGWYATKEESVPKDPVATAECKHTAPTSRAKPGEPSPPPSPGWPRS